MSITVQSKYDGDCEKFTDFTPDGKSTTVATIAKHGVTVAFHTEVSKDVKKFIIQSAANTYRLCNKRIPDGNLERIPVVVSTEYEHNKLNIGIQFWTPQMIDVGQTENTDKTISHYVCLNRWIKKGEGENTCKIRDWQNYFGDRFAVDSGEVQTDYFKDFTKALYLFEGL